jgi:hypothetical protein
MKRYHFSPSQEKEILFDIYMVKNPPDGVLLGLRGYGPAYSGTFV